MLYAAWHFMYSIITHIPHYRILYYVNYKNEHRVIIIIIIIIISIIIIDGLKAVYVDCSRQKLTIGHLQPPTSC